MRSVQDWKLAQIKADLPTEETLNEENALSVTELSKQLHAIMGLSVTLRLF